MTIRATYPMRTPSMIFFAFLYFPFLVFFFAIFLTPFQLSLFRFSIAQIFFHTNPVSGRILMFLSQGSAPSDPRDTRSAHGTAVRCPLPGKCLPVQARQALSGRIA